MNWVAQNPEVIHTELEDGAVLLNMSTGYYYSLDETGLEIWRQLERGSSAEDVGHALAARFDVSAERAASAASAFIGELTREELVVPSAAPDTAGTTATFPEEGNGARPGTSAGGRRPFTEPALEKHAEPLSRMSTHPFDPQLPLAE